MTTIQTRPANQGDLTQGFWRQNVRLGYLGELFTKLEKQNLNLQVTRRQLSVTETRDSITGWRQVSFAEDTIKMYIETHGVAASQLPAGVYVREDAVGISYDYLDVCDQIVTSTDVYFEVESRQDHWLANSFLYHEYQLHELPLRQEDIQISTVSTWKTSPADPRSRTKLYLDEYLNDSAIVDNDGTQLDYAVIFNDPPYHLRHEFRTAHTPIYGLYIINQPTNSEALLNANQTPYGYDEDVPIEICTVDSLNVTGVALNWRMEAELRKVLEEHPTGSQRKLQKREPLTIMGSDRIYRTQWTMPYRRGTTV